jgi:hypothetical protein
MNAYKKRLPKLGLQRADTQANSRGRQEKAFGRPRKAGGRNAYFENAQGFERGPHD